MKFGALHKEIWQNILLYCLHSQTSLYFVLMLEAVRGNFDLPKALYYLVVGTPCAVVWCSIRCCMSVIQFYPLEGMLLGMCHEGFLSDLYEIQQYRSTVEALCTFIGALLQPCTWCYITTISMKPTVYIFRCCLVIWSNCIRKFLFKEDLASLLTCLILILGHLFS